MAETIGSFYVEVSLDDSQIKTSLNNLKSTTRSSVKDIEDNFKSLQTTVKDTGKSFDSTKTSISNMGSNAKDAYDKATTGVTSFSSAMNSLNKSPSYQTFQNINNEAKNTKTTLSDVGMAATAAATGFATMERSSSKAFSTTAAEIKAARSELSFFDKAMVAIAALGSTLFSSFNFKKVDQDILNVGKQTDSVLKRFSAIQADKIMYMKPEEVDAFIASLKNVGNEAINTGNKVEDAGNKGSGSGSKFDIAASKMESYTKAILAATAAVTGFVYAVARLGKEGETELKIQTAFNNAAMSIGEDSNQIIADLKRLSKNSIDDSILMQQAIKGFTAQNFLDPTKLNTLMNASMAVARRTGRDVKEVFSDMVDAVGNDMPRALVRMGALSREAASNIGELTMKGGEFARVGREIEMELIGVNTEIQNLITGSTGINQVDNTFSQFNTAIKEVKDSFTVLVYNTFSDFISGLTKITQDVTKIIDKFNEWGKSSSTLSTTIKNVSTVLAGIGAGALAGAGIGSIIPGVGTGIGAVAGATAGAITTVGSLGYGALRQGTKEYPKGTSLQLSSQGAIQSDEETMRKIRELASTGKEIPIKVIPKPVYQEDIWNSPKVSEALKRKQEAESKLTEQAKKEGILGLVLGPTGAVLKQLIGNESSELRKAYKENEEAKANYDKTYYSEAERLQQIEADKAISKEKQKQEEIKKIQNYYLEKGAPESAARAAPFMTEEARAKLDIQLEIKRNAELRAKNKLAEEEIAKDKLSILKNTIDHTYNMNKTSIESNYNMQKQQTTAGTTKMLEIELQRIEALKDEERKKYYSTMEYNKLELELLEKTNKAPAYIEQRKRSLQELADLQYATSMKQLEDQEKMFRASHKQASEELLISEYLRKTQGIREQIASNIDIENQKMQQGWTNAIEGRKVIIEQHKLTLLLLQQELFMRESLSKQYPFREDYKKAAEDIRSSIKQTQTEIKKLENQNIETLKSWNYGWTKATNEMKNNIQNAAGVAESLFKGTFDAITSTMSGTLKGLFEGTTQSWEQTFKNFFQKILDAWYDTLAKMVAEQAMLKFGPTLGSWGQSFFGWMDQSNWMSIPGMTAYGVHSGGVMGEGGQVRTVSPLTFANAQRFHLGTDEVPAILQKGERVISKEDNKKSGNQSMPISVNIKNEGTQKTGDAKLDFDGEKYIINVVLKDLNSYGPLYHQMKG